MKALYAIIALIFLSAGCSGRGVVSTRPVLDEEICPGDMASAHVPDMASGSFHERKRFTYHIAWNGIPVGSVTAESGDIFKFRERDVRDVRVVTRSNRFLSAIYRVEDVFSSYVDVDTMSSMRYEANRREGLYRKHVIVEYDFDGMRAIYTNLTDGSVKSSPIYEDPHDPVSAVCYFLSVPLSPEEDVDLVVNLNEKNYEVRVKVEGGRKVTVPAVGSRKAFKVTPRMSIDGEEFSPGRASAYVSADDDRYPMYGVVRIPFGTVTATLVKVEDI